MLFVHIGMAKAGSTQLQHFLAANQDRLAEADVLYPEVSRQGVAHHPLSRPLATAEGIGCEAWVAMREFLAAHRGQRVVLSSEGFEAINAGNLRTALSGFEVKIICYVRETMVRLPSTYSQNTKLGLNVDDFDTYFERLRVEVHRKWLYGSLFEEWASAFGAENIRVRSLDRDVLDHGDLTKDFLGVLGITANGFATPAHSTSNESPGWMLLEALRAFHARTVGSKRTPLEKMANPDTWLFLRRALASGTAAASKLGWTERGRYLSQAQNELLTELYDRQLDVIDGLGVDSRLRRFDLDPSLNREFLPEVDRIPPDELAAFLLDFGPRIARRLLATDSLNRLESE